MKKALLGTLSILLLLLTTYVSFVRSSPDIGSVTLAWDCPKEERARTCYPVSGYKVYFGEASKSYDVSQDVEDVLQYTVSGLMVGKRYYFAVTAYYRQGDESNFSNEVTTTVSEILPSQPAAPRNISCQYLSDGTTDGSCSP